MNAGGPDQFDGHAQRPANGFQNPGPGKALQRSLAGAGCGEDRVWQVWRRAGQGAQPDANRAQHPGPSPDPQQRDEPRFAAGGRAARVAGASPVARHG